MGFWLNGEIPPLSLTCKERFRGTEVQRFKGSKVQSGEGSKWRRCRGSKVQRDGKKLKFLVNSLQLQL
jgi:hypothetical protein